MKCHEQWNEQIPKPSDPNTTLTNQVRATAYNNDGTCTVVVVGDAILFYDSETGEMINKPIRGAHKDTINCVAFSKDGKRFATCSDDKSVVIFKYAQTEDPKVSAELKYTHQEEVYTLAFNPLTGQIFSAGSTDYSLWTPDQGNIEKSKFKQKIICSSWAADGMTIAFGTMNGQIVLKGRKLEEKADIARTAPVWCMDWTPITPDNLESVLCVGCWDQTIALYNQTGQQLGTHRHLQFDPLSIQFFSSGEFYILSGSNKKASLYAKEGGFLIDVCEKQDWIWGAKLKPKEMNTSIVTNDGQITQYKITPLIVHSLSDDKYVCRDGLTDVLVQSIEANNKIRLKCKELVKNVSVYKEKLAALLNERILIYINTPEEGTLKYKLHKRINKKFDCRFFEILSQHILIGTKKKIQLLKLTGEVEREWMLDSTIKFLKNSGGPSKGENILIGLQNGNILKIMVNNSFPVVLHAHQIPIMVCDLSMDRKRLAVVDKNKNLTVYDLLTKEIILNEMQVTSCAFNTLFNDSIAYGGMDMIHIKSGNHPPLSQRYKGKVVGYKGNKLFVQDQNNFNTLDISMTSTMLKFIDTKNYQSAYQAACLGITNNDFKILGMKALENQSFDIAKKCFLRINELEFFELVERFQLEKENGTFNEVNLNAQVLAYQQKFMEAESAYVNGNMRQDAVQMWIDLKRFPEAKRVDIGSRGRPRTNMGSNFENQNQTTSLEKDILEQEAQYQEKAGNWKDAAKTFIDSRSYKKAIDIYMKKSYPDGLIEAVRQMSKEENLKELQQCAYHFRKIKHHQYAKETYLKLGDTKSQVALHIEMEKFEDALRLGKQDPNLLEMIKLPYAHWLSRNDRYQEALLAFKHLNRHDLTTKMLYALSKNAVEENRFDSAATYFWILSTECLKLVQSAKHPSGEDAEYLQKFADYNENAEIYYSYNKVYQYIEEPVQPLSGIAHLLHIFNSARFCISKLQSKSLFGVKQSYIYYALGKVSKQLEGYKTARQCYEKLSFYKINADWNEEVDLNNLLIRSKPFSDKESLMPICNRCMNTNSVIQTNGGNCSSCHHPFINSFISFENLPLVEFRVDPSVSHQKVVQLLYSDKSKLPRYKKREVQDDGWNESTANQVKNPQGSPEREKGSLFLEKLNEIFDLQQTSEEYLPIVLDEQVIATLEPDEVYWIDYRKYCPTMEVRYFKCMISDIALKNCVECGKFFFLDEFEFEYLKSKQCPFCKAIDHREGPQKDVFDI